jgi:lysozyme family protein
MADYTNIVSFIKSKEGGKSSATTDTASRNPSPCGNGSNGYPYHTNKGVTWETFSSNASLGYTASCSNFLAMPNNIWGLIYKKSYWNPMKGDEIRNQAIANSFVEMAWGSGVGGATNMLKQFFKANYNKTFNNVGQMVAFVNDLDRKGQTPELFEKLYDFRANKYASFSTASSNLKGWMNRLDAFYALNKPYALSKTNIATILIGGGLVIGGAIYLYYKLKK